EVGEIAHLLLGITPMPIYDPEQKVSYLTDFMVLFNPGDIVKWAPIDREEHDAIAASVEAGTYRPKIVDVEFDLDAWNADIDGTNAKLMEALNGR
ncbi:MAG: allophanate hydrolase, partial [Pseudomonadota bacterium]